MKGMHMHF